MTVHADKLLRMAEQIRANLAYSDDDAMVAAKVADHLNRFWDPRMKTAIKGYAEKHPEQLSSVLRAAVQQLT